MTEILKPAAVLAVVGALGFAGCGGDDETTTTSESGASGATGASGSVGALPAEFIAEADAICDAGDEEIDAAASDLGQGASEEQQAQFVSDVVVPQSIEQVDAVRDLDEPSEGADELNAFLDDAEAALNELGENPEAAFDSGGGDPFADIDAQATALGFESCGR